MRFNYLQLLGLYLELLHNIKTGMKTLYKRPTTTDNNQFTKFLQTTSTLHLLKHLLKSTMKISLYLSLLLLALVIKIVTADLKLPPQQYCGSRLADIMQVVCKNKYNGPPIGQKRSKMDSDVWDYKELEDYNAIDYPYQPRQEAMSFMPTRILRSSKRTIIDECCRRPCLISELKGYCAN